MRPARKGKQRMIRKKWNDLVCMFIVWMRKNWASIASDAYESVDEGITYWVGNFTYPVNVRNIADTDTASDA